MLTSVNSNILTLVKFEYPDTCEFEYPDICEFEYPDTCKFEYPDTCEFEYPDTCDRQEIFLVAFFGIEYLVRLWAAGCRLDKSFKDDRYNYYDYDDNYDYNYCKQL